MTRYRRVGYNLNVMRRSACLVYNLIMVDKFATFFNYTPVGRASDSYDDPDLKLFIIVRARASYLLLGPPGFLVFFFCSGFSRSYLAPMDLNHRAAY